MKPRHMLMGVALAGAAALVLFGDKAPSDTVAEAVERKPARAPAAGVPPAGNAAKAAPGEASILRLVRRRPRQRN